MQDWHKAMQDSWTTIKSQFATQLMPLDYWRFRTILTPRFYQKSTCFTHLFLQILSKNTKTKLNTSSQNLVLENCGLENKNGLIEWLLPSGIKTKILICIMQERISLKLVLWHLVSQVNFRYYGSFHISENESGKKEIPEIEPTL